MYALLYFPTLPLIHSLIHSHWLTWPRLVTLNSAPWKLGGYQLRPGVLLLLLATLNSATPVSQWAPAFIDISSCITARLPCREHPCHSGWLATMHSLQACTHMSPLTIYSSGSNNLTHTKTQNATIIPSFFLKITIFKHTANFYIHRTHRPLICLGQGCPFTLYIKMASTLL